MFVPMNSLFLLPQPRARCRACANEERRYRARKEAAPTDCVRPPSQAKCDGHYGARYGAHQGVYELEWFGCLFRSRNHRVDEPAREATRAEVLSRQAHCGGE